MIKKSFDVGLNQPLRPLIRGDLTQFRERLMRVASWTEPVRTVTKFGLPDRLEYPGQAMLNDPVFKTGDTQRPLPSIALGDVDAPDRLRSVAQAAQFA